MHPQDRITYAVVRNGAVWKCWDRLEQAIDQATQVAALGEKHARYQGFDEQGKSAVVSRPVVVTVERLEGNRTIAMVARWEAGERRL